MGCGESKTKQQPLPISIVPMSNTNTTTTSPSEQLGHVMTDEKLLATCLRYEEIARQEISENGILTGERYKEALDLLSPGEQEALKACFGTFKIEVHKLQGVLTDWLFDEKNQKDYSTTDSTRSVSNATWDKEHADRVNLS